MKTRSTRQDRDRSSRTARTGRSSRTARTGRSSRTQMYTLENAKYSVRSQISKRTA